MNMCLDVYLDIVYVSYAHQLCTGRPGASSIQLCPADAGFVCYTPDAVAVGGAAFGCGLPRPCPDGTQATAGTGGSSANVSGDSSSEVRPRPSRQPVALISFSGTYEMAMKRL